MIVFVRDALRVLAKPCSSHTVHISRRMDGQLSTGERAGLWVHTRGCSSCRAFARQLERLRSFARAEAAARPVPQTMPVDVRARLNATLTQNPTDPRPPL